MKRTLRFSLWLAMASFAAAQTPTVAQKPGSAPKPKADPQVSSAPAKPSPATVKVVPVAAPKPATLPAKPAAVPIQAPAAKPVSVSAAKASPAASAAPQATKSTPTKTTGGAVSVQPVAAKATPGKADNKTSPAPAVKDPFSGKKKIEAVRVKAGSAATAKPAADDTQPAAEAAPKVARKIGAAGRRDPFVSPVVSVSALGSGCSSGKRCLSIEQIALRGVVRSDTGMIAVVVNALDKAYFLRENDPVFNGFVEKITADSIVFKQTFHDKLGKPLTRDVTKTISRPAA